MPAGTVISGGFPGRVAQEVQPNQKCEGCLHYDRQAGRTGACTIGERPWNCGEGEAQEVGYAPLHRGAGSYLPDLSNHGAHAPEVDPHGSSDLYGVGSTRPVTFHQVSLGEEHVHLVKSMVESHTRIQKSQCRLCSMQGSHGTAPANVGYQVCTCAPIQAETVAKAIEGRMSNALRVAVPFDELVEWVREVTKAGFRLPIPKKARSFGARTVDSMRRREDAALNRPRKPSLSDQIQIDNRGGHLTPVSKGEQHVGSAGIIPKGKNFIPPNGKTSHGTYSIRPASRNTSGNLSGPHKVYYTPNGGSESVVSHNTSHAEANNSAHNHHAVQLGSIEKAIDNTKHSHIITGRLAPHGVGAAGIKHARSTVDRLDKQYGASAHTYAKNPNFKPDKLKWEKTSAYGPGGHTAEAGHGTYTHEPMPHGQHVITYHPRGAGAEGALHGGSHSSPAAAHAAAQAHHDSVKG